MKSLSGMVSNQTRSDRKENAHTSSREQAIRSCLPIAATALLMIFIGGFPPTTWVLLFQTFGQLNALLASKGPGMILPLMILIVQSLLLLAAWLLLGWVILREGTYLMTMQSKAELDRLLAFQSATGELINLSQIVTKQLPVEQDFDEVLDTLEEDDDDTTTSSLIEEEPEDSWASRSIQSKNVQSRNMSSKSANVQSHGMPSKSARSKSSHVQSHDIPSKSIESRTAHAQSRRMSSKSANVQLRDMPPRTVQSPRVELDDRQSHKQKSHNLQSHRTLSSRRGLSTSRLLEEELLENPFERNFKEDLPSTPQIEDNVKQNRTRMVTKNEKPPEEEDDDDNPFVYGNPFDGPLPEVFRYDAELRRSVLELKEEESGTQKAKRP